MSPFDPPVSLDPSGSYWLYELRGELDRDGDRSDLEKYPGWRPHHGFGISPAQAAFGLLRDAARHGAAGLKYLADTGHDPIGDLEDRLDEANLIEAKLAYLADPAFINHAALKRRRAQGEKDPKPRVRIHAERTIKGNLVVKCDTLSDGNPFDPDLLPRPPWPDISSTHYTRPWAEALFIRKFDDFAECGGRYGIVPNRLEWDEVGRAMLCVFTLRAFQYAVYRAREVFELSFGDVLCLRMDKEEGNAPFLEMVPFEDLLDARRAKEAAYVRRHEARMEEMRRYMEKERGVLSDAAGRLADLANEPLYKTIEQLREEERQQTLEWAKTLETAPHVVLARVEAAERRGCSRAQIKRLVEANGLDVPPRGLNDILYQLREGAHLLGTEDDPVDPALVDPDLIDIMCLTPKASVSAARKAIAPTPAAESEPEPRTKFEVRFDERFAKINELRAAKGWSLLRPIVRGFKSEELLRKLAAQSGVELPP